MILRFIWGVLFALTLTHCATSPVTIADSRPVPHERLLYDYAAFSVSSENTAKVIVVRDSGTLLGAAAKAKLFVDGMPIATVWPAERVEFFIKAGSHILAVAPQPQLMGALVENSFVFETGKQYFFRISISGTDSAFRIQPTTQIY